MMTELGRQAPTVAELATAMTVQFQRPGAFHELPGGASLDERAEAQLLGADLELLRRLRGEMRATVAAAAASLIESPDVRDAVAGLPRDLSIAVVGDSLSADHQSWAEIVREVLSALRPDVELLNLAKSGDTTMDSVRRLGLVLGDRRPALFVVVIGTNDATRTRPFEGGTFISDEQTRSNCARLAEIIAGWGGRSVWVTPPPLLDEAVASFPVFELMGIRYTTDDVARKADIVRACGQPVIDLWETFSGPDLGELLMDDGLHLDAPGQLALARRVLLEGLG
jgi:lysophospholipase L1-like esterase